MLTIPKRYDYTRPYPHVPATGGQLAKRMSAVWAECIDDIELLESFEKASEKRSLPRLNLEQQQVVWRLMPVASYLYFLYAERSGLVKIGRTKEPGKRISSLRTMSAEPLKCLGVIRCHFDHEQMLHAALHEHRSHGEWFKMTNLLADLIDKALDDGIRPIHEFIVERLDPDTKG